MPDNHPIAQEELMAYLGGEVSPDRAATAADHLERCRACQNVAADLQGLSRRLMAWEVEPSNARITETIAAALSEPRQKSTGRMSSSSKWVIGLVAACVVVFGNCNHHAEDDVPGETSCLTTIGPRDMGRACAVNNR